MSDFERSGMTYDEPAKRRSPGTFFADLGDRLARGFNSFDKPVDEEEPAWEGYDEADQPTAAVDVLPWEQPGRRRFPTALHGYDREAVDAHIAALERELADAQGRSQRATTSTLEDELERLGAETSAILKVAHEQAAEITRRAQSQADRCVADAAANAVAMTEEAKRKLRQLDTETDAVWAERGRLIEDARNVATALFSLAEDAADRFPEDGERGSSGAAATVAAPAPVPPAGAPIGAPARVAAPPPIVAASPPAQSPGAPSSPAAPAPAAAEEAEGSEVLPD